MIEREENFKSCGRVGIVSHSKLVAVQAELNHKIKPRAKDNEKLVEQAKQIEELKLAANRKMLEKRVVEFLYGKKHKANTYTPICFLITATALLCCAPACREKRIEHAFCVETLATNIKKHIGRIGHRPNTRNLASIAPIQHDPGLIHDLQIDDQIVIDQNDAAGAQNYSHDGELENSGQIEHDDVIMVDIEPNDNVEDEYDSDDSELDDEEVDIDPNDNVEDGDDSDGGELDDEEVDIESNSTGEDEDVSDNGEVENSGQIEANEHDDVIMFDIDPNDNVEIEYDSNDDELGDEEMDIESNSTVEEEDDSDG